MKRSYLKKQGSSETSKCKRRIQKLLTQIVRLRDGGCIFRNYPDAGACNGYTAADHINSRQYAISYAETRNCICACTRHHIYWKPQHPTQYTDIVERYVGPKTWKWIKRILINRTAYSFGIYEWGKYELALKQELKALTK